MSFLVWLTVNFCVIMIDLVKYKIQIEIIRYNEVWPYFHSATKSIIIYYVKGSRFLDS